MKDRINPIGLKGQQITERMKELMGIQPINENRTNSVVELTKLGPDGKIYGIVRENHEYYIKTTTKKENIVSEDFSYIGGLQNKKEAAYPSYAKAIKQLKLKFNGINEAIGKYDDINVFENDNLMGCDKMEEKVEETTDVEGEDDLNEIEQAIEEILVPKKPIKIKEHKLSVVRTFENLDSIIDSLPETPKKSLYDKIDEEIKYKLKLGGTNGPAQGQVPPVAEPTPDISNQPDFGGEESKSGLPFDKEPFNAGVEADEETDPKKFIQQLSGKLGQSLRKYTDTNGGQPDFKLEKFAVNSVLSATHTGEMDPTDQDDIIKKVKGSGEEKPQNEPSEPKDNEASSEGDKPEESEPTTDSDNLAEGGIVEMSLEDNDTAKLIQIYDKGNDSTKHILSRVVSFSDEINREKFIQDLQDDYNYEEFAELVHSLEAVGIKLDSEEVTEKLHISDKLGSFANKDLIKSKLAETINKTTMSTKPLVEPSKPKVSPKTTPSVKPSRRNKPFQPNVTPDVNPDPKAIGE